MTIFVYILAGKNGDLIIRKEIGQFLIDIFLFGLDSEGADIRAY